MAWELKRTEMTSQTLPWSSDLVWTSTVSARPCRTPREKSCVNPRRRLGKGDFSYSVAARMVTPLAFLYLAVPSRAFPSSFRIAVSRHTGRNDCIILSGARGKCAGEADKSTVEIEALRRGGGLSLALREYRLHTLLSSSTCRSHDVLWWWRWWCCRARAKQ
jgi:hypothetical protein